MEKIRFSQSTQGFYPKNISYSDIPSDIVDVSLENWEELMGEEREHRRVVKNGRVIAVVRPSNFHDWNDEVKAWQLDKKSQQDGQRQQLKQLQRERLLELAAEITGADSVAEALAFGAVDSEKGAAFVAAYKKVKAVVFEDANKALKTPEDYKTQINNK